MTKNFGRAATWSKPSDSGPGRVRRVECSLGPPVLLPVPLDLVGEPRVVAERRVVVGLRAGSVVALVRPGAAGALGHEVLTTIDLVSSKNPSDTRGRHADSERQRGMLRSSSAARTQTRLSQRWPGSILNHHGFRPVSALACPSPGQARARAGARPRVFQRRIGLRSAARDGDLVPQPAVEVDVVAVRLPGTAVGDVRVQRVAVVGDLARAVGALDRAELPGYAGSLGGGPDDRGPVRAQLP